jgi:hypothetical protein
MDMNWILYLAILGVLVLAVVALLIIRSRLAGNEENIIHVQDAEAGMVAQQAVLAQKLTVVDRWGKTVTVVTLLYGLFLAGLYVYQFWTSSSTTIIR